MTDDRLRSYGVLLLRLSLGTMFLAHSVIYMLLTLTLSGTSDFFNLIGLPSWLAYATFLAEVVGGIFLIEVALKARARWNQFLDIDSQSIIISAVAYKAACAPTKDGRRPMLLS